MGMRHKKWMNTIAGSAVLAMALAGCGGDDSGAPAAGQDDLEQGGASAPEKPGSDNPADGPEGTDGAGEDKPDVGIPENNAGDAPNVVKPPAGAKPVASKQIKADLPKGHPKKVLTKDSTLSVTAQESGCEKATAEVGKQTSSQVEVTIIVTQPKDAKMCTMDIRFPSVNVDLDKPIGDRTVVLTTERRKG